MPRQARKRAESGIYHVMLRGIDRQMIFEDSEDCLYFIDILQQCREECGFKLYAYCLMGNHVHILLKVEEESIETIFKRIGGRYVYYYNVKYRRVGHLFQDRFKSEPVENDTYLLTVLRYIHQNPIKAKLCTKIGEYPYSSYAEYLHESNMIDTEFVLRILPHKEYIRFNNEPSTDKCLEIVTTERRGVTDQQAQAIIEKYAHCRTIVEFQSLDERRKERYIKKIYEKGVSVRQASRLTGTKQGAGGKMVKVLEKRQRTVPCLLLNRPLSFVQVSFLGVTESDGSQFNEPKEGHVYVLCEFEILNNSDEEVAISSMISFEGYCDDYACEYSLGALMEKGDKNQLDGSVAPGKKMKGVIGYEVPTEWKELEIQFTPDFLSGKEIVFVAAND